MKLDDTLALLARDPDAPVDLAEIALQLARDEYPWLDVDGYLSELDSMAKELRPRLRGSLKTRVRVLSRYLFHEMGFRGNKDAYYDARNSYFNEVLDRRLGIPITLSAVAIAVGTRAGLDICGIGLPGHFVTKLTQSDEEIVFDPFNGGRIVTADECAALVEAVTGNAFDVTPEVLQPTPMALSVVRMLTNLKGVYLQTEDFLRAARVSGRIFQIVPQDISQQRDLGVCLYHAEQFGKAITPLEEYLAAGEEVAADRKKVEKMLDACRSQVAQWN